MRRFSVLLGAVLVVTLVATTAGQAGTVANFRFEQPSTDFNPCTNEWVDSTVSIHIVLSSTVNDNNARELFHLNFSVSGVGQTTGARYTGSEAVSEPVKHSLHDGRSVVSVVNLFRMTTPGGGNNWVFRLVSHVTVDADGDVTVSFDKLTSECR